MLYFLEFCAWCFVEQFTLKNVVILNFDLCENSGHSLCENHFEKWEWTYSVTFKTIIVRIYVNKSTPLICLGVVQLPVFFWYIKMSEVAILCTVIVIVEVLPLTNLQRELKKYIFFLKKLSVKSGWAAECEWFLCQGLTS